MELIIAISYTDGMELSEIEAFMTIQLVGSCTKAAEAMHLSQPAISRRIELLERKLGVPLFERLSSGIRLSEVGRAFLPHARQVLAAIEDGHAVRLLIEKLRDEQDRQEI
ncbi:LysR family transcriptional regulator [Dictyobacter aurantiacus]|uniref:HTH lysR-type domain-containing protein n=1 Tax=Dictyobacter aurantiacus TaxID=1936993 RepID=A0A401ZJ73_9CHLR|nr:LysR family transcriptional regulator [Dictyobacter aurantiacus]GCE06893.1 hypothetical protein KDAU_42220 [Dictyobacter aurantiacus]